MNNKIQSLKDYTNDYHNSIETPEKFWSEIADRFDWRGVDCSRASFLSQRKSVLRNDGFARGSVRGDEDAFVAFDASDGFFLKRVQFKRKSFGW